MSFLDHSQGVQAVARSSNIVPLSSQNDLGELPDSRIVIDYQDAVHCVISNRLPPPRDLGNV
jgi:hypothetical protein